jgi:lysozyme family protein|tara:strand:+ start:782 stop:1270 length:489 start_codon:yes stop_codon:yes gene_type:complete
MKFHQVIKYILGHEGGYVFDKADPGGETNFGISKRNHPEYDIKSLTVDNAKDIYKKYYWKPSKAERLPNKIAGCYFDMVVNMGQGKAVKILQKAINASVTKKIAVDGRIGPQTIEASKKLDLLRLISYRIRYYSDIISKNNTLERFWYGWFLRALSWKTNVN